MTDEQEVLAEPGGGVLQAPFPFFGGKSRVAPMVWTRFGDVQNFVEPFFGSGAVLLGRPSDHVNTLETVNDKDALLCNFWRAIQAAPAKVAEYADWPVNESDLTARHIWLVKQKADLVARLEGDPDYYDAKIAGWWVWGICSWIGGGWCSGEGPWTSVDGKLARVPGSGERVKRERVHLGSGVGVNRKLVHLGDAGKGVNRQRVNLTEWFTALANRLRRVRVCCGDWTRVMGPTVTFKHGITGIFLDPPYSQAERDGDLYSEDAEGIAAAVREWAIANRNNPLLRICLAGYQGEHDMPAGWTMHYWQAHGGYAHIGNGRGKTNRSREILWFSPHCLAAEQGRLL